MTTVDTLNVLYRLYDNMNNKFFKGELPEVFITIVHGKKKRGSFMGVFYNDTFIKGNFNENEDSDDYLDIEEEKYEIGMASDFFKRPYDEIAATLLHEMVHLYCHINNIKDTNKTGKLHTKKFRDECEKRSLEVTYDKSYGWGFTDPSPLFSNYIDSLNLDMSVFDFWRNTTLKANVTPKKFWICPICRQKVQAKKTANVKCGICNLDMDYWNITDEMNPECIIDKNDGLAFSEEGWYGNLKEMMEDEEE